MDKYTCVIFNDMKWKDCNEQYQLMKQGKTYCFDGYLYNKQKLCTKLLKKINNLPFDSKKRSALLQKLFGRIGNGNIIKDGLHCNFGFNITIGNDCYINYNVTILDSYEVEIGNNVFIAPNVIISPVTHPLKSINRRNLNGGKITICDDAWIGAGAIILPNIMIGKGAVVGAGAVVTEDVKPFTVVGGVPAKFIKNI